MNTELKICGITLVNTDNKGIWSDENFLFYIRAITSTGILEYVGEYTIYNIKVRSKSLKETVQKLEDLIVAAHELHSKINRYCNLKEFK